MKRLRALALLLPLICAACGSSDSASYMIGDSSHALTLVRNKDMVWDDRWELALVVSRFPDCLRRYALKDAGDEKFKLELYRAAEGGWILHQGSRWYVAETGQCGLQQFKTPPPEPGTLLGAFSDKSGDLKFVPEAANPKPADAQETKAGQ